LAVAPSSWGQAGAVKAHKQASEFLTQEPPEAVLNRRSPPLLLLLSKHPRG